MIRYRTPILLSHCCSICWLWASVLFFRRPRSEGWPDRGRTFSSFRSRMLLQATLAPSSVVSSLKSVCCDFHIFCSDASIACLLFNLVRNSVVHSPSSVIRDPRYGNVSTCSSSSFWMSMRHAMPSLAITLVLSTLMSRLYLRLTRSRRSTNSCSSAS